MYLAPRLITVRGPASLVPNVLVTGPGVGYNSDRLAPGRWPAVRRCGGAAVASRRTIKFAQ